MTDNKLKSIIREKYLEKTYTEDELHTLIPNIITEYENSPESKKEPQEPTPLNRIMKYVYKNGFNYMFNIDSKRSVASHPIYCQKIIEKFTKPAKKPRIIVDIKKEPIVETNNEVIMTSEMQSQTNYSNDIDELERIIYGTSSDNKKEEKKEITFIQNSIEIQEDYCTQYIYPKEKGFVLIRPQGLDYVPYGSQWIHDDQIDDDVSSAIIKSLLRRYEIVRKIISPEQRSKAWFALRETCITASDAGAAINMNSNEPQWKFVLKKVLKPPFLSNAFVHHGKKHEDTATMIYEYRMNVQTEEFGLIIHPTHKFLGASPDRICNKYKLDGKHLSKYVGRMLEIKCPYIRVIKKTGDIIDNICPLYYWVQVQLQLECCDLDECDFWQCTIREYDSKEEFVDDTDPSEYFRSKEHGFEKGCLIQMLPKSKWMEVMKGGDSYDDIVWTYAKYVYPPHVEMSPHDCDLWIADVMNRLPNYKDHKDLAHLFDFEEDEHGVRTITDEYMFDKVIYWKLEDSWNTTIMRDKEWFSQQLPVLQKIWDYVLFYRNVKEKNTIDKGFESEHLDPNCVLQLLVEYIENMPKKASGEIMSVIDKLYNVNDKYYAKHLENIKKTLEENKEKMENKREELFEKAVNKSYEKPAPQKLKPTNPHTKIFAQSAILPKKKTFKPTPQFDNTVYGFSD